MGIGMRELVVILLVVLLVFGAKKLRTIGSDLGAAVRGFKKSMNEGEEEESTPPRQIRSDAPDAEFTETAKPREGSQKTDRSAWSFPCRHVRDRLFRDPGHFRPGARGAGTRKAASRRFPGRPLDRRARGMARQFREQLEEEVNLEEARKLQPPSAPEPPPPITQVPSTAPSR